MNMSKIREGQGITYKGCRGVIKRGIVVDVSKHSIGIAHVHPIEAGDKCYDDEGAVKELHKDNVRLRDCPPPFSVAYQRSENGLYCHADMNNIKYIKESEFASKDLKVIDNGAVITDSMMDEIKNHPWQEQLQKQKVMSNRRLPYIDYSGYQRKDDQYEP